MSILKIIEDKLSALRPGAVLADAHVLIVNELHALIAALEARIAALEGHPAVSIPPLPTVAATTESSVASSTSSPAEEITDGSSIH